MNQYIAFILADRDKTEKERQIAIDLAAAPFDKKISEANEALTALGYNPEKNQHTPKVVFPNVQQFFDNPTIKQRVTSALRDQYPQGAHYSAILEYINEKWPHLEVKRVSLSPQLSRLRKQRVIDLNEKTGIWYLVNSQDMPKKDKAGNAAASPALDRATTEIAPNLLNEPDQQAVDLLSKE